MYLRKNKVRCGTGHRVYLSIAHNVWWAGKAGKKAQSRPVVIASFGVADGLDLELAHEVVVAVENCTSVFLPRRGQCREEALRKAGQVRRIEPLLKMLASSELALRHHLPLPHERLQVLEILIRQRLEQPSVGLRQDEMLEYIQTSLGN